MAHIHIALWVALLGLNETVFTTAIDVDAKPGGLVIGPSSTSRHGETLVEKDTHALLLQSNLHHAPTGSHTEAVITYEHDNDGDNSEKAGKVDMWGGVLMAFVAGASTVLGATVVLFMPEGGPPPAAMAFSFSLAAGVMVAISVEMLLPHNSKGQPFFSWGSFLIFCAGALSCAALCKLADCFESTTVSDVENDKDTVKEVEQKKSFRLAALLFVSLTLHNFPEGFAVAVSAMSGLNLGLTMCIAVAIHNIPEGIALAVSVYGATKSHAQSFFWTALSGLTEPLGAICAMLVIQAYVNSTPNLLTNLLTAVAGVMCWVALAELLPEAVSTGCWGAIASGFVSGIIIMVVTHWVMENAVESIPRR